VSVREYDPEHDAVKPPVQEAVQPPVQQVESVAVIPAVSIQEAPQDAILSTNPIQAVPSPSLEPKAAIEPIQEQKGQDKEIYEHLFINKIIDMTKHWAAMLLYFGCGLVVGWMACMVAGQSIACDTMPKS
jgi:hypothetical protein